MTDLAPGKRLRSTVSDTEVIVVRPPAGTIVLSCGGHPMTAELTRVPDPVISAGADDALLGKRYVDSETGLEVLCTKSGFGVLAVDDRALTIKAPNALPASD